jgi:hypothetical protein
LKYETEPRKVRNTHQINTRNSCEVIFDDKNKYSQGFHYLTLFSVTLIQRVQKKNASQQIMAIQSRGITGLAKM